MKMVKLLIQDPRPIKARLDALRQEGTTASGFIRHLLEQHFNAIPKGKEMKVRDGACGQKRSRVVG
jgi:hypothetical protein